MKVFYYTNYTNKDTDSQYRKKKAALDTVVEYCAASNLSFYPVSDHSEVILHVTCCNALNEPYIVVAEDYAILPPIHDKYPFISRQDLLKGKLSKSADIFP